MKPLAKIMIITALVASPLIAHADSDGRKDHPNNPAHMGGMDHSKMNHEEMAISHNLIKGTGVINSVSVDKRMVNITHEPITAINWPKMTMDLPVTKHVDLDVVKVGSEVDFMLKLGMDKQYRITKISGSIVN